MDNLVRLEREGSVKDHIEDFINGLSEETTRIRYSNDIRRFLNWKFKGVPIEHLQYKDINSIQYMDMKKFQAYLRKQYANSTVNGNMYAIMSMFKELKKIKDKDGNKLYFLDTDELQVKRLKETDSQSYGTVSWEELETWRKWLLTLPESQKPKHKAAWLRIAMLTGIRKQGLADLTFRDLRRENDLWVLHHSLKGKKYKIAIPDEDAEMLLSLRLTNDKDEPIFHMSTKTMERVFKKILTEFNVDPDRNVVIHSIRGESGYTAYKASGNDIIVAMNHLGHEDANTTMRYINKKEGLKDNPSLYMGKDISSECLNHLTLEQWRDLFDNLDRGNQFDVINKAKELGLLTE